MTDIRFYHLQRSSIESALPLILEKALERGMRAHIRVPDKDAATRMDQVLWTYKPEGFLPHGIEGDPELSDHPIIISDQPENINKADVIVLTQGCTEDNLDDYDLCCEMLNGGDQQQVEAARARWKIYKDKGYGVTYWAQDDAGRWHQKA